MVKKKGKKEKSKDAKTDGADNEIPNKNEIKPEEKNVILNSQCELLAEQLIKYKDQSSETAKLATKLKHELRKNDLKTTEMIAYLQNEIHQKDIQIEKLRNANYSLKSRAENHEQLTKEALMKMEKENTSRFTSMQKSLNNEILSLQQEVESLKYVKKNKSEIENALLIAKTTMEAQAEKFKLSIDKLESKYIVDTQRIRESSRKEIEELKNRAKEFAEQELNTQSRQIRAENKKYKKDLSFHLKTTSNLHVENQRLIENQTILNRDIELLKENEIESAKQSVSYKQRIKQLTSKLHRLEENLNQATEEWEKIRLKMIKQFNDELNILQKQNKTLKYKNNNILNELNSLKHYSKKLISQRSEIEQFFHEALDEVKQKARERLEYNYQQELSEYSDSLTKLGLNINSVQDERIANDEIGLKAPNKIPNVIKLEYLTFEEREHVLRILISKINLSNRNMEASLIKNQIDIKRKKSNKKHIKKVNDEQQEFNQTFVTQKQVKQ